MAPDHDLGPQIYSGICKIFVCIVVGLWWWWYGIGSMVLVVMVP